MKILNQLLIIVLSVSIISCDKDSDETHVKKSDCGSDESVELVLRYTDNDDVDQNRWVTYTILADGKSIEDDGAVIEEVELYFKSKIWEKQIKLLKGQMVMFTASNLKEGGVSANTYIIRECDSKEITTSYCPDDNCSLFLSYEFE